MKLYLMVYSIQPTSEGVVISLVKGRPCMGKEHVFIEGAPELRIKTCFDEEFTTEVPCIEIEARGIVETEEHELKILLPKQ